MKKYEYIEIWEGESGPSVIDQINDLATLGWRVVNISTRNVTYVLMERELSS